MEQACHILEISRSGFYEWLNRKPSARQQNNIALRKAIIELHNKYPSFGLDSIYHTLKPQFHCSRKSVHKQMQLSHIHSVRHKVYKSTTNSRHSYSISPNILQRNFSFNSINQAWVSDITCIPTDEGWLYLAIVKDLCDKKIVGYAFSERIDTNLTLTALNMTISRRKPGIGLIFHSDGDIQYASTNYRERLKACHSCQSMSRAVAENFFTCLKCELVYLKHYRSRDEAKLDIFAYIEAFFNNIRPHSALVGFHPILLTKNLTIHILFNLLLTSLYYSAFSSAFLSFFRERLRCERQKYNFSFIA